MYSANQVKKVTGFENKGFCGQAIQGSSSNPGAGFG